MSKYYDNKEIKRPDYLGGGHWVLQRLNEITVLFGRNGSGKSILLRSLRDIDPAIFHYTSPERSGDISVSPAMMEEQVNASSRASKSQNNLDRDYRQGAVSRLQALKMKAGDLALKGKPIPYLSIDIENLIQELLPDFQFAISGNVQPIELKRVKNQERVSTVSMLSSGESEALTLALDLLTICAMWVLDGQEKRVLLIDEPDTHLHPDLQQHLASFIVKLVDKYKVQVIVATHSTTLLSALGLHGGEKTSVIYLDNATTEQNAIAFNRTLQELSTCLGGHALMGPLFSAPLLLVEGDDDYKIWSHVPRYHSVNLAVIPCHGDEIKKYQKTLENIFHAIRSEPCEPVGYALMDGDKNLPQENEHNTQKHIKFLKLECRESENLYLTDEVLQRIDIDWEVAKQKIKSESVKCGQKKEMLDSCDKWDRKMSDIKDVIVQLSQIIDAKNVPWTMRVAKAIGDKRPEGQLAEFLGTTVVDSLWGKKG